MEAYLGIDVGSVGIKLALIDEKANVSNTFYARNRGIIETVQEGLEQIIHNHQIKGVGVTGSGREFTAYLVGADIVKTEILAHTIATLHQYPSVRTILDIGGEDCKIMSVRDGVLNNFIMNSVCGAGTGSVLDSVANRMGISTEEIGSLALQSTEELSFPGKCGVFAQSSVVSRLNAGKAKSDILMGIVNALVNNYLMLGRGIDLSPPYVYQEATAKNKAIVKALEKQLDSPIIVPEYCAEMGAIGIALLVRKSNITKTKFRGDNLKHKEYTTKSYSAEGCDNRCEISVIYEGEEYIGAIGNRCEKCIPRKMLLN